MTCTPPTSPSLKLLAFVAGELAAMRVLIVGTFREADARARAEVADPFADLARAGATLPLRGLDVSHVTGLIAAIAARPPPAELVEAVAAATGGNSFFLDAVVRLLVADRRLDDAAAALSAGLAIPEEVREAIRRRLAALAAPTLQLLDLAAVLGREFDSAPLRAAARLEAGAMLELLDPAIARGIVTLADTPGRFAFAHALVRETLYEDLTAARRTALHRRAARGLEALYAADPVPHLSELAHHSLAAAADGDALPAIEWAGRAGDRALERFAYEEAVAHFEAALSVLALASPDPRRECALLLGLGKARTRGASPDAGRDAFRRAADLARRHGAADLLARAALGLAWRTGLAALADPERLGLLSEALDALPPADALLRVRVQARLAVEHFLAAAFERADVVSREALAAARRLGDPRALAHALSARQFALWHPDGAEERLTIAAETVAVAAAVGDGELAAEAHLRRFADLLELGRGSESDRELDAFVRLAVELRQPFYTAQAAAVRAMRAILAGRLQESERLANEALAQGQQAHNPHGLALWIVQMFPVRREQGRSDELVSVLEPFTAQYWAMPAFLSGLALLLCDLGRLDDARGHFDQLAAHDFADLRRDMTWLTVLDHLAQVCAALGDVPRAATLYALLAPYERRHVVTGYASACSGAVARNLGMLAATLGRHDAAIAHLEVARSMHLALGARRLVLHTLVDLAAVLLTRAGPGDAARATSLLEEAAAGAAELALPRLGQRVDALRATAAQTATPLASGRLPPGTDREESRREALHAVLRRDGDVWLVGRENHIAHLRSTQGLCCLAQLLANPGVAFHALELAALGAATPPPITRGAVDPSMSDPGDAGELLDPQARAEYRRRLGELGEELEQADAHNDLGRSRRLRAEVEALQGELARAVGLGGRMRRAGSRAERARVNVQRVLRLAVERIAAHDGDLGHYLDTAISTGTFCSYTPDPRFPVVWTL